MYIIVGLGNPGQKYQNNRHNVGHMFIDYLKTQSASWRTNLKSFKTDCFMNQSGAFVKKLIRNLKLEIRNLVVVHDDLDIPLGKSKIQKEIGPPLHNGIESIEKALGRKDFWRVRIGVDNRPPKNQQSYLQYDRGENETTNKWFDGETYVLQDFKPPEKRIINETFPKILHQLKNIHLI